MTTASRRVARRLAPALALAALAAGGCGPAKYPVAGRVAYEDGSPLPEGSVVGETSIDGAKVMARGEVGPDGTFAWGTAKAGDGARPGTYKVIVLPRALSNAELAEGKVPAVDERFTAPATSEIVFEVKEGKNEFKVTVSRPVPKPDPVPDPEGKKDPDPKAKPDPDPKDKPKQDPPK